MQHPTQKPEYLSDDSLSAIHNMLAASSEASEAVDRSALAIFDEFADGIKENPELWEAIAGIRHQVYNAGLKGGAELIDKNAKEAVGHEELIMHRTVTCLRAMAELTPKVQDRHLGLLRARFLKPDLDAIRNEYFEIGDDGSYRLKKIIISETPTDKLLSLLMIAEEMKESGNSANVSFFHGIRRSVCEHLIKNLITEDPKLIDIGGKFLRAKHFNSIVEQMPYSLSHGKIGREAGELLLAHVALEKDTPDFDIEFTNQRITADMTDDETYVEGMRKKYMGSINLDRVLKQNNSFYIGSHVLPEILLNNPELAEVSLLKTYYQNETQIPEAELVAKHEAVQEAMLNAKFPTEIEQQLSMLFVTLHERPIAVRSSGELEDMHGASFAGQYKSVELANSSDFERDFEKFKRAVLQIYSSVFSREVMEYRKNRGLLVRDEEMAILIQDLNADKFGERYRAPLLSSMAMSHATQSIGFEPSRGAMRIEAGLGSNVVGGKKGSFAMFEKPDATYPGLTVSQQNIAVMDLESGERVDITPQELAKADCLPKFLESYACEDGDPKKMTFDDLLAHTNLPLIQEYIVQKLSHQLGYEVDCEFTVHGVEGSNTEFTLKLVQCRPQNIPENSRPSRIPKPVEENHSERIVVRGEGALNSTKCENINFLVYIEPRIFEMCDANTRDFVYKFVDVINRLFKKGQDFENEKWLLVVPKRWGSKDSDAGLKANFANFSTSVGVAEIMEGDTVPSFGTHFLQTFMDAGMIACALQPGDLDTNYFDGANYSKKFPDLETALRTSGITHEQLYFLDKCIKVIDINSSAGLKFRGLKDQKMVMHLAQDNTHRVDDKRSVTLYFAERGKDLPETV